MDLVNPKTGRVSYLLAPPVVGFFEYSLMRARDSIPKKRMAEALHAYTHGDEAFAREAFGGDTVIGRALVHETALADDPLPDVLDWERATAVVGEARSWAVSLCYCRHKAEHLGEACGAPMEICLSLNGGADFVVRRGFGRSHRAERGAGDAPRLPRRRPRPDRRQRAEPPHLRLQLLRLLLRAAPRRERLGPRRREPERLPAAPRRRRAARAARAAPAPARSRPSRWFPSAARPDRKTALAPRVDEETLHRLRRLRRRLPQGRPADGARPRAPARPGEFRREGGPDGPRAEPARRPALRRGRGAREPVPPPRRAGPHPRCRPPRRSSPPSRSAPGSCGPPWRSSANSPEASVLD